MTSACMLKFSRASRSFYSLHCLMPVELHEGLEARAQRGASSGEGRTLQKTKKLFSRAIQNRRIIELGAWSGTSAHDVSDVLPASAQVPQNSKKAGFGGFCGKIDKTSQVY